MSIKILITGGTGFIGSELVKNCIKRKYQVTTLSSKKSSLSFRYRYNHIICDLTNKRLLLERLKKKQFDYIVNLAGYVDHNKKKKTYRSHFLGVKNLFSIFKNKKIKKFIQIGSSVEYGKIKSPQNEHIKINEKKIKSTYGLAKFKATNFLINEYKKNKFPSVILRLFLVYGPRQKTNRLIPFIINNALKGNKFPCSDGNQYRDFTYIDDVVDAIMKAINNKNCCGKIINICSGKPIKIKSLINQITKIVKKGKPLFGEIKLRPDEPKKLYSNNSFAKKQLKWSNKTSFDKGLKKTIKFYEKQI